MHGLLLLLPAYIITFLTRLSISSELGPMGARSISTQAGTSLYQSTFFSFLQTEMGECIWKVILLCSSLCSQKSDEEC